MIDDEHNEDGIAPFAAPVIRLLQGIIHYDEAEWETLLTYQRAIERYLGRIGLALYVDELGGFAYVTQPSGEDTTPEANELPRLTRRRELSYKLTMLCVLLRERLDQHEGQALDQGPLYVDLDDMTEMLRPFLGSNLNDQRLQSSVSRWAKQLEGMNFLRASKEAPDSYEVRPILRAKVNAEQLVAVKDRLGAHQEEDPLEEDSGDER